jgi:ATP synthase protein I
VADEPRPDGAARRHFEERVRGRERRLLRARGEGQQTVWFGLGMFGLVGWSVAVPTVVGALIGWWLDRRTEGPVSWTLTLLLIGVAVGCANAWRWLKQEGRFD